MPQDAAHPNARFHEDPAFTKFSVSDPTIFETNVTEHVPIFFFHEDQWRVATAAGAHSTGMRFLAERRALADDCVLKSIVFLQTRPPAVECARRSPRSIVVVVLVGF